MWHESGLEERDLEEESLAEQFGTSDAKLGSTHEVRVGVDKISVSS